MPKYWGKQSFTHRSFPEVGLKQKTEREKRKKKRLNNGDNNGQAMHGARKHEWCTQAAWANRTFIPYIIFLVTLQVSCHMQIILLSKFQTIYNISG